MYQQYPGRLDSWKEIASYLGRDVRTAIRWEKDKSLPVHRVPGGKRQAVFAYRDELDVWLAGAGPDGQQSPHVSPAFSRFLAGNKTVLGISAAMVAVLVTVGALRVTWRSEPVRAGFEGNRLVAYDKDNREVWSYAFTEPLFAWYSQESPKFLRFEDLRGDGERELIAIVGFPPPMPTSPPRHVVYCFSSRGKLLWQYEPTKILRFGGKDFSGPWTVTDVVLDGTKSRFIWVSFTHQVWWPSFVVRLDSDGGARLQYVQSGHIRALATLHNSFGSFVLAAGVNNEFDSASLAVVPQDQVSSASPQSVGAKYACDSCAGDPHSFVLFPRSEISRVVVSPFHMADWLAVKDGTIEVQTGEANTGPDIVIRDYVFNSDLQLQSAEFGDNYWKLHDQLYREHKLDHDAAHCPERRNVPDVRVWSPSPNRGWSKIELVATDTARKP
jgi:hypothetical protein